MTTTTPTPAQLASDMTALMERWRTYTSQLQAWLGGTATGGPNGDGMFPLTDHLGNTFMVPCPALEASRVDGEVNSASSFADAAQASAEAAVTNVTNAKLAQDAANDFANASKAARDLAQMYADTAGTHAANAKSYSEAASSSAVAAAQSASEALASLDTLNEAVAEAQGSASAALASEQAAAASERAAAGSASAASASASSAASSASQASSSASAALASQNAAKTSENSAATSASNAKTSETNAKSSEVNAKTSETNAAASAAAAKASEAGVHADAVAAAGSASAAAGSATAAASSATKAQVFEPNNYALRVDPVISDALMIQPNTSTSNPVLRFLDYNGNTKGSLYWNIASDGMIWAKNKADGTLAGYCSLLTDGSFWNQYGAYFGGSITTDGSLNMRNAQAYIAHAYPLVEFRQPGAAISQGEGFVGSWNGDTLVRSWPSATDHTGYLDFYVNRTLGVMGMRGSDLKTVFKATSTGGVQVEGTSASYNIVARDYGQTWSTYATGNQYRVWANTVGDIFTVGISGDAYIKNGNGGGSLQIGDDSMLIDVNINHTLGIQSLANRAAGFIKFGNAGARIGWDTAGLYADGTHTSGLGTTSAGYVWHTGNFGTGPWYGNMNQCLKSGLYRMGDGSNSTNLPGGGSYGQMLVSSGGGGDTTTQLLMPYNTDNNSGSAMYFRGIHGNGTVVHAWRTVWDDNNLIISSADPGYIEGRIWIQI
ncbi:hypothetical protein [Stenotrophomonas oahuensis]|uniref:Phage tail protein n=1 Tax=Stenotrophomonas oahuensis TaxID=3003271 RepID=A0ABY9YQC8_9GAMM|nr:hypothetical protein [Stenotrophomonas sp. A5586]WNH52424.1 hypothetical protein PDM29_19210 [Stenotrophomonas sp. A5586]